MCPVTKSQQSYLYAVLCPFLNADRHGYVTLPSRNRSMTVVLPKRYKKLFSVTNFVMAVTNRYQALQSVIRRF